MVVFDSPIVEALVERARRPLDAGLVNEEVMCALNDPNLTRGDRGQLLLAQLVLLQGSLSAHDAGAKASEAVGLLRYGSDIESLQSALAISATLAAAAGDRALCLDHCLDLSGIVRASPANAMSFRSASNFGGALMVLGAYDLAAPLFVDAIRGSLDGNEMFGVVVSCANLLMTVSRRALVMGSSVVDDPADVEYLNIIDEALHTIQTMDLGQEMRAFVQAVLANSAQLRGNPSAAREHWGELDALQASPSESFTQYLCLVEAPLAIERGDHERAHLLIARALEHLSTPHIVPLGRVDALKLRSVLHEQSGDVRAALKDARDATDLVLRETRGFADLLITQIDSRAALEHRQQALVDRASALRAQTLVDRTVQAG